MRRAPFIRRAGQAVRSAIPGSHRGDRDGGSSESGSNPFATSNWPGADAIDLPRRRDELQARVAELQWDLGGLVYEMATRDRINIDVIVRRAAELQAADAELNEAERILRLDETATAGECGSCGAPHSVGAVYCWQCGQPLLRLVEPDAIGAP